MPVRRIRMLPTDLLPLAVENVARPCPLMGPLGLHTETLWTPHRGTHPHLAAIKPLVLTPLTQVLTRKCCLQSRAGAGRWMSDQLSQLRASHAEQLRHLQAAATEEKAAATADLVAQLAAVRAWACADGIFAGRWSRPKAGF